MYLLLPNNIKKNTGHMAEKHIDNLDFFYDVLCPHYQKKYVFSQMMLICSILLMIFMDMMWNLIYLLGMNINEPFCGVFSDESILNRFGELLF